MSKRLPFFAFSDQYSDEFKQFKFQQTCPSCGEGQGSLFMKFVKSNGIPSDSKLWPKQDDYIECRKCGSRFPVSRTAPCISSLKKTELQDLEFTYKRIQDLVGIQDSKRLQFLLSSSEVLPTSTKKYSQDETERLENVQLLKLFGEVAKFNKTLKAVDIQQQLSEITSTEIESISKTNVLKALKIARENLSKAMKIMCILRENKEFMNSSPELFEVSLTTLQSLQVNEKASDYAKLISSTLEVAVELQKQMKEICSDYRSHKLS